MNEDPVPTSDPIGARASLGPGLPDYVPIAALAGEIDLDRAPVTVRILLENVLRHAGRGIVTEADLITSADEAFQAYDQAESKHAKRPTR